MERIGFAILLNDETHNYARELEMELCRKFNLCWGLKQSPHITVKSPFYTKDIEKFAAYLENLSKQVKPFEIEINGADYFGSNVIFLNVKETSELKNLHHKILKNMKEEFGINKNEFEGRNIRFHSTIALNDVTKSKLAKAKKYLEDKKINFKFKFDTLGLFYYLGEDAGWIIYKRFKLHNG